MPPAPLAVIQRLISTLGRADHHNRLSMICEGTFPASISKEDLLNGCATYLHFLEIPLVDIFNQTFDEKLLLVTSKSSQGISALVHAQSLKIN